MTTVFIASSRELVHERLIVGDALMDVLKQSEDMSIRLIKWEYIDSNFGQEEKQNEYESHLITCDIVFVLLWKKLGVFTQREYELARAMEKEGKHCYVLFKNVDIDRREDNCKALYNQICNNPNVYGFTTDEELYNSIIDVLRRCKVNHIDAEKEINAPRTSMV